MFSGTPTSRLRFLPYFVAALSVALIWSLLIRLENPVALDDGLRHFAMGQVIAKDGIQAADWGRFFYAGYFAHHQTDPWFLSDVLYSFFAPLGVVMGLKVIAILSIAFLIASFFYAFRVFRTSPLLASAALGILLFFEPSFFYRLLVGRPYELITPLAVLIIVAAIDRRAWLMATSLALSILLSQLFVFPLFLAAICIVWRVSLGEKRDALKIFLWTAVAVTIGFALHPHPLEYALFIFDSLLRIPFIPGLALGTEMHSGIHLGFRVPVMIAALILLHAGLLRCSLSMKEYAASGLSLLALLVTCFSVMFLSWSRSIDVLWPILMLLLVRLFSVRPEVMKRTAERLLPASFRLKPLLGFLIYFLLISVVFTGVQGALVATDDQRSLLPFTRALQDLPAGSTILNPDWHFFMPAVLVRPDLRYGAGMDPSFTLLDSPAAEELLAMLDSPPFQSGELADAKAWLAQILAIYPSDALVLFTNRHEEFIRLLERDAGLKNISKSPEIAVFRVR